MPKESPAYPRLTFNILWFIQIISSAIVLVFFYVTWANVKGSPELVADFSSVENTENVSEWKAPWFFILVRRLSVPC